MLNWFHVNKYISNQKKEKKEERIPCAKICCWLLCFVSWVTVLMWKMDQKLLSIFRFAACSILSLVSNFLILVTDAFKEGSDTHPLPPMEVRMIEFASYLNYHIHLIMLEVLRFGIFVMGHVASCTVLLKLLY